MSVIELPADLMIHSGTHDPETERHCLINCAAIYAEACGFPKKRKNLPWDDHQSICRVVRSFAIGVNDAYTDDVARTKALRPITCLVLGTEGGKKLAERRMYRLMNFALECAVIGLRAPGIEALIPHADNLEKLIGSVKDKESARAAYSAASAAYSAAARAAYSAARAAYSAAASAAYSAAARAARNGVLDRAAEVLLEICLYKRGE